MLGYAPPVSFREFVSSPDFCNNENLYEFWYNQERDLPTLCNELILDGSIGGGKSTFSAYYLAYRIYLLFQSGSPQLQLGLPNNSDIYCLYFSVSLSMAQKSGYSLLYSIFSDCKWFKDNAPIDSEKKSSIVFTGKHFQIDFASGFSHQIGLNVWGFVLDEANFRSGVGLGVAEEYAEVTELYQQLIDRQISRFARPDGSVDALAILVSSASYQSSFSEKRAQAIKSNPFAKRITVRKYEVTPERFSQEKFTVFIGSGSSEPCIITSDEHRKRILKHANLDGTGQEDSYFLEVPVNLKPQYEANIVLALQNHSGVSTNMSSSFMPNLRFLYESYVDDILPVFESETVEASTDDNTQIREYLLPGNFQFTNRPHSVFLDLSVAHDVGAVCCYRYDGKDDRGYDIHTRVFSLHIQPPPYPATTRIEKVKQFIIDLAQYINIVAFASDQYQCLGPDTLVPTSDGIKRICEIRKGDVLFCKDGTCTVTNTYRYENATTVDVITKRGHKINCTPNHRFSYIKSIARTCVHGDKAYSYPQQCGLLPASDMLNKRVDHAPGFMIHGDIQQIFGVDVTPDFAEYIGWMTGDGGISGGRPYLCCGSLEEREIILTLERRLHNRIVPAYWANSKRVGVSLPLLKGPHKKALVRYFGKEYRSFEKHVPDFIMKSPKAVVDAYLRGLYSSDGSCTKEQVVLTSISYRLLQDVQVLLSVHYGLKTQIVKGKRGYSYDFPNAKPIYHLRSVGSTTRFIEIGFWQEKKLQNLCETFQVKGKGYADYVVSIQPSENKVVYDIEVDSSDHTYYLWDMLTHNSTQLRQDVQAELGLPDTRISIDSSDQPYILWARALVDARIRQPKDEYLEREVREAVHDHKKHRVLKAQKSTDDVLQANVGAFFLSDTIGKGHGCIDDLYDTGSKSIIGASAYKKMLRDLGYK